MRYESQTHAEDRAYARLGTMTRTSNVAGYTASLARPRTDKYVVMPNGTVEFIR